MQKHGFPSMKSLDQFKSLSGSFSGVGKTFSFSSRAASDSLAMGSFANLKITAGLIRRMRLLSLTFFSILRQFTLVYVFAAREDGERASFD